MKQAPEGFRDVEAEEATGVRIDREALAEGVILQYRGTRRFPGADRPTTVHIFLSRGGQEGAKRFSVFGSSQLDSKLRDVKKGSVVWLIYAGKSVVDGQPTHVWQVSNAGLRLDSGRLAELRHNSRREEETLDAVIDRAEQQQQQQRANRGGSPAYSGEYTDVDAEAAGVR
ncbi:MAG TPA: hypothetical protein VKA60_27600 [Blastocatellia bacterium]|nr:hypothetical protein [Blastocatellia bacterium]